ncbi:unnamed protein product [Amaranthus hypochondriacus]
MAFVQEQAITSGSFKNETFAKLELIEIKTYCGHFQDGGPSAIIEPGEETSFKHQGEPGSKVAVAYRGHNDGQWVCAWHVYPSTQLKILQWNKVLGKHFLAGESIDWDKIEKELDESTTEISNPYFKATVTPHGYKADLDVKFLNVPF